jgi:hypothetical protein
MLTDPSLAMTPSCWFLTGKWQLLEEDSATAEPPCILGLEQMEPQDSEYEGWTWPPQPAVRSRVWVAVVSA